MTDDDDAILARVLAEERIRSALSHIQQAQNEMERACADLSTVVGLVPEWSAAAKMKEAVRSFWYRINARLDRDLQRSEPRLKVDGVTLAAAKQRTKG